MSLDVFRKLYREKACSLKLTYIHGILEGELSENLNSLRKNFSLPAAWRLGRLPSASGKGRAQEERDMSTGSARFSLTCCRRLQRNMCDNMVHKLMYILKNFFTYSALQNFKELQCQKKDTTARTAASALFEGAAEMIPRRKNTFLHQGHAFVRATIDMSDIASCPPPLVELLYMRSQSFGSAKSHTTYTSIRQCAVTNKGSLTLRRRAGRNDLRDRRNPARWRNTYWILRATQHRHIHGQKIRSKRSKNKKHPLTQIIQQ